MTSKEMLGQLMAEHYKSAQRAKSEGRLVAWATSISPQELLETIYRGTEASEPAVDYACADYAAERHHEAGLGRSAGSAHNPVPAREHQ